MDNWLDILGWSKEQIDDLRMTGFLYLREGSYKTAVRYFEALIILDPSNAYDIQTLGGIYMQMGQHEKSLEILNRALIIQPGDSLTLLNKVKVLLLLNRKKEALEIALELTRAPEMEIANEATALILAYK